MMLDAPGLRNRPESTSLEPESPTPLPSWRDTRFLARVHILIPWCEAPFARIRGRSRTPGQPSAPDARLATSATLAKCGPTPAFVFAWVWALVDVAAGGEGDAETASAAAQAIRMAAPAPGERR